MADKARLFAVLIDELSHDELFQRARNNITIATRSLEELTCAAAIVTTSSEPMRIEGYVKDVVSLYSQMEFHSHFRMHRSSFEVLCRTLAPEITRERSIPLETRVLSTLWILGNTECYRSVADRFGMSKVLNKLYTSYVLTLRTLHLTVLQTTEALCKIKGEFIKFPNSMREFEKLAEGFSRRCGMPGVVGAIDGTHVAIPGPRTEHRASFINRKGYPSIQLQVVCDSNLKFTDTYTGWPGSVHDARVFRNSPMLGMCQDLPGQYHLLGDSAYPLSNSVMVPYRDNGQLSAVQKKFNKVHASTRVEVERAIGLLKGKFRRLKHLEMFLLDSIPKVITACCVLHNFVLELDGEDVVELEVGRADDDDELEEHDRGRAAQGQQKRDDIANML